MKFIAIIPARYASTRFPGKPLAMLGGKPVVERVYEQAKKVIADVYVATDDERIFQVVNDFGGCAVMTRSDHKSGTDRIEEAVEIITQPPSPITQQPSPNSHHPPPNHHHPPPNHPRCHHQHSGRRAFRATGADRNALPPLR